MGQAGCLPLREGTLVMSRPNIEGPRTPMGDSGPGELHQLRDAYPTPPAPSPVPAKPGQLGGSASWPGRGPGTCPNKS